jgi:hypothetical protein
MEEKKETPEDYNARTGRDVPKYMAVYARFRTEGRRWNMWKIIPYHEAETMIRYYTDHEIVLATVIFVRWRYRKWD